MQVEQISYGSVNRSRMKGYQVIGKSAGVDTNIATAFCQWAPSHNSLETSGDQTLLDASGLSFFALSEFRYAIARSVHGGPEYSGRGGLSVVTSALVMTRRELVSYDFHAVDVARTALAFGHLILPIDKDETLPCVTLTRRALPLALPKSDFSNSTPEKLPSHAIQWIARETASLLRDDRKVMIVGDCDPLPVITLIFDQLNNTERAETSFAFGIKPSSRRDFRVQFTQQRMSPRLQREMDRAGIAAIDVSRVLVESR